MELEVGQVWRSPDGKRTREITRVRRDEIEFRTSARSDVRWYWGPSQFRGACKGWTLDAPAEEEGI